MSRAARPPCRPADERRRRVLQRGLGAEHRVASRAAWPRRLCRWRGLARPGETASVVTIAKKFIAGAPRRERLRLIKGLDVPVALVLVLKQRARQALASRFGTQDHTSMLGTSA